MHAIIKTGSKQYKVIENQFIRVESLAGEVGEQINLSDVLLVNDGQKSHIGSPIVEGASVVAEIQFHARADKVKIIKFKRRKHHLKRKGHRQNFTQIKIVKIELKKQEKPVKEKVEKVEKPAKKEVKTAKKTTE